MKKLISILTCVAFTFSSVHADEAPPKDTLAVSPELATDEASPKETLAVSPELATDEVPPKDTLAVSPELADDNPVSTPDDGKKHVGEAANDGSKTAGSGAGKYVLAACAIVVGIAALILVSRHSGHKN